MNKLILAVLIAAFLPVIPVQATIYVGGEDGLPTISEAIEKASENETIIVYEGIYLENIEVDKSVSIRSYGKASDTVIEAKNSGKNIANIRANNVTISGFTIRNSVGDGIYLDTVEGCNISGNNIDSTRIGIYLLASTNNKITHNLNDNSGIFLNSSNDNLIVNNTANSDKQYPGICLSSSNNNIIIANNASNNFRSGIALFKSSSNNTIKGNTANSNNNNGIYLENSHNNSILNNTANLNKGSDGIDLKSSNTNEITNNTACENSRMGLRIEDSEENIVTHNSLFMNLDGFLLSGANKNELRNNTACENSHVGLQIQDSEENIVTHNSLSMNLHGIVLMLGANKNELRNNSACENSDVGLQIQESEGNIVTHNSLSMNLGGIVLTTGANKNELRNNTACENGDAGLQIQDSEENIVTHNSLSMNLKGIFLLGANKNELRNNSACENSQVGLQIQDSEENIVTHNSLSMNLAGIFLGGANKNELRNNSACENSQVGLQIQESEENIVTHNSLSMNLKGIGLTIGANKNELRNNTACENSDVGLQIQDSEENIVTHNSLSMNSDGIFLIRANKNELRNNTACENSDVGLQIQDSEENIVTHNSLSMNLGGIFLIRANKNELRNNNVVDSKDYQAYVQDSSLNKFNYNYWSDYEAQYPEAQEKSNTGIGNIPYEIKGYEQVDYDDYPYMNYSGWLNVVITPEYWEFFTKKGDIQYFYNNFSIENRLNSPTEVEILLEQNLEFVTDSEGAITKTFRIAPKSTENITLRLNVTNLEGYILRTITFKTEDYTKTTLVHGLVQPKINEVKIEGVDYHRNVVKGQINPFNVMLRNHGDKDVFNVTLTMGSKKKSKCVFLSANKSETKTVPFEIDTSDMPLGITRGQVVVLKSNQLSDPPLDYLNLTMYVASELEASTLIVTNHKRMRENWGTDSVNASKLKDKVLALCFHPAVNGIILDVASDTNISILFDEWDNAKRSEKANEIANAIKRLIETKCKLYQNIEYLVIVGDDRIIPYYRITDNTSEPFIAGWDTERNYHELNVDSTVGSALYDNMFLTDNIYAADRPIEWETAGVNIPELYIPIMPVSRLVESPDNISAVIDAFFKEEYVNPDKIFVCGSDFMKDSASLCGSELEKKTEGVVTVVMDETANSSRKVKDEFLNVSNNILFLFQHAHHDRFNVYMGTITSHDIARPSVTLNNSFVCSMGCHSGLNVPPNSSSDVPDLVEAFAQKGVTAYIAPTGYSIGLRRTIGAHELLYSYLNKYLCEGRDVGTALTQAKQEYWATNYDFDHIDEKVLESTTLYGLPWVRIRLPRLRAVGDESEVKILSFDFDERVSNEQPDTLVIRPLHRQNSTPDGNYYMTQSRELLSDPGKPVQPKEIRVFYPTAERVLRGAVLNSSKYHQNKSFTPLIDAYMQSDEMPVFKSYRIENWYPAQIFKINSIRYPKDPTQSRQYLIIITGQYKGRTLPGMPGEERLYKELSFDLYYATSDENEIKPPVIMDVSPTRINDTVNITVNACDNESGIRKVMVTYTDINGEWGEWRSKDCDHEEDDLWTCSISTKEGLEFFVQAVDNAANVAVNDGDGRYFTSKAKSKAKK